MTMTADFLHGSIRACLVPGARLAVIHSSLRGLSPPVGQDRQSIVASLQRLADDGCTIACPTFTLSFCSGKPYHWRESASETGVLGQWLLDAPGARRTPHPLYSFAVLGPLGDTLAAAPNATTFGADSVFARFFEHDAQVVMLGTDWSHCTQCHFHEEEAAVPYRRYKDFSGEGDLGHGWQSLRVRMFVRDLDLTPPPLNSFAKVEDSLRSSLKLRQSKLWKGSVSAAGCRDLADACRALLAVDPYALLENPDAVRGAIGRRDALNSE